MSRLRNALCRLLPALAVVQGAVLLPAPAAAEMPSVEELQTAVDALAGFAVAQGLRLQLGPLWHDALRLRTPLVATLTSDGRCLLGYSAYLPGRDYSWLFPVLAPEARLRWLRGAVAHELAHCAARAVSSPAPPAPRQTLTDGPAAAAEEEALADLAFAQQLGDESGLVERLAGLRAMRRLVDPAHDSSALLRCMRAHPAPAVAAARDWLVGLRARQLDCQGR